MSEQPALKIQVVRIDGRHETLTLITPVTISGMCIKTATGCDHFFTEDGLYDGWGMRVDIPVADESAAMDEVMPLIQAVDDDREIHEKD